MRKTLSLCVGMVIGCSLALHAVSLQANEAKDIIKKIDAVLRQFPASSTVERDDLAGEILSLGREGILELAARLVPIGEADDSLVRYALDGVATHVTRPGAGKEKVFYAGAVLRALRRPSHPDVKAFLISQLQLAGGCESIKALSGYLKDDKVGGPAVRALTSIGGPEAEKALMKALDTAPDRNKVPIVKALGEMRSRPAVEKILRCASNGDMILRQTALFALANIGDPRAESVLRSVEVISSPVERTQAASRYLLFARRLAEGGRKEKAVSIYRAVIEKYSAPGESQVRSAALGGLTGALGDDVLGDLLAAGESPDKEYREKALELSLAIPGEAAAAAWIKKAAELPPDAQAQVISMLGRRREKTALPFVIEKLRSDDQSVRLAAIPAAAGLGGKDALPALRLFSKSVDEDEIAAWKQALLVLPGEIVVPEAASVFPEATPQAQAALLEILAEREAAEYADLALTQAQNENEKIRLAALGSLERLARAGDITRVIDILQAATNNAETTLLQNALVASANKIPGPEERAAEIINALGKTTGAKRINLLRPLAKIGGSKALQAIVGETESGDPQLQAVAVHTLSNWLDGSAADDLLKIARAATDRKIIYLALQGYMRLLSEADISPEEKYSRVKGIIDLAQEEAEKNLILSGLANIRTREALMAAAGLMETPSLQAKAAQAVMKIALPGPGFDGLTGVEAAFALKKAAPFIEEEYDREQIQKHVNLILSQEGFLPLFNGKDLSGWKGLVEDPVKRAKMTPEELRKAQAVADEDMRRHWRVLDGVLVFDGKGHSLCTEKDYGDVELFVDWKIEPGGDSGVYLRGSPQIQIWDPSQWPEGSGGLYNNKLNPSKPLTPADRAVGEWNTFYIKMAGERVTVHLNGVLVVDNVVMENYWERDKPIYPVGQIELQAHSTPLYFKNIYIRQLARD